MLKHIEGFLIEKTAITAKHDRDIRGISPPYKLNNCSNPVNIIGPMIGMSTAFSRPRLLGGLAVLIKASCVL